MPLPDFIGIGSQKCGSSWLYSALNAHPQIQMSEQKELHFFCARMMEAGSLEWYKRQFDFGEDHHRLRRGEITPNYARLPRSVVQRIAELAPALRIILIIRNPVERDWSQVKWELGKLRGRSISEVSITRILLHLERWRTRAYSDYERTIDIWQSAFGSGALHVALYDDLRENPQAFISQTLAHLGLGTEWSLPERLTQYRPGATEEAVMPELVRAYLKRRHGHAIERLDWKLGGRVSHWLDSDVAEPISMLARCKLEAIRRVVSMPEKMAYGVYSCRRDQRLATRCAQLVRESNAVGD